MQALVLQALVLSCLFWRIVRTFADFLLFQLQDCHSLVLQRLLHRLPYLVTFCSLYSSQMLQKPFTSLFPISGSSRNKSRIFSMAHCMVPFFSADRQLKQNTDLFVYYSESTEILSTIVNLTTCFFTNFSLWEF